MIERVAVDELQLDPRNPRLHGDRQIKQIAGSIKAFGFNVPVLVNREKKVLAGHGRVHAARRLGLREIPIIRLEHLSPEQARAFSIADNRLSETSSWDDQILGEILRDLAAFDLNFDLEATGFTMGEIDLRIEGLSETVNSDPDPADVLPEPMDQTPVSRLDDLWQLGRHRLLCGNALDQTSYDKLMQSAVAGLVFTDPPYNVPTHGHVSGNGRVRHREFPIAAGEMTSARFVEFLIAALKLMARYSAEGSLHYIFMDWRHQLELLTSARQVYSGTKDMCVWVKDNAGLGTFYRSQHELIFVFKNGKNPHCNNIELSRYGRNRTNVWHYPGLNNFGKRGEEGNLAALHPTVKPVNLVADAILDSSTRGDVVLDPFLGRGSTLIAAERTGRTCYGMELDSGYMDATIRRWQKFTGGRAIHAITGKSFDSVVVEECTDGQEK